MPEPARVPEPTPMPEPTGVPERIRVVLVDDHHLVREGVRVFLDTQPDIEVIAEAATGAEAVALIAEHRPTVALVDLLLDGPGVGMSGVEVTREAGVVSPDTRVMVLTSYDEDGLLYPALRAGALSYLLKDVASETLAEAIRTTARGEAVLHPRIARRLVHRVGGHQEQESRLIRQLTEREIQVLEQVARGLSNRDIAKALVLSEPTVKGHVSNVLAKLQLEDRTQAAVFAWRHGLVRD